LSILLHNEARHVMEIEVLETCQPTLRQLPIEIPIEGSINGWVWQHQQPYVSGDIQQETRFPLAKTLPPALKSLCALPLTTAGRRLGVLNIASDKVAAYDQFDLEFAGMVAAQIAVAVENAINFQQAQSYQQQLARERDRSALLLEVSNMLVSNL